MKVAITGATGLVGKEMVELLLQNGHVVHYLTTSKEKIVSQNKYKGFYWNPEKGHIDTASLEGVEVIIHLAGASVAKKWTAEHKKEILSSRVLGSKLLFDTLKDTTHNVKQVIAASAIGIYPDSLTKIYHETDQEQASGFLGEVVKKWEQEVSRISTLGILVSKIRFGIVLAKEGGALQEMVKPIKLGLGSALGSGLQYQSWIHLQDVVGIINFVMEQQLSGIYNAVAPYPVTNDDLSKAIAKVYLKPYFMPNVPRFILKMLLGEMHEMLLSSQHVSSKKILELHYQFKFATLEKALQNLK